MNKYLWASNTTKELSEKIKQGQSTVILPFGSTEQHGDHLASGYDTFIAERIAADLAHKLNALILPTFSIGEASHHLGFKGTLSFSESTLLKMLGDLCDSLIVSEITNLIIVNGHGGNYHIIRSFVKNYKKLNFNIIHDGEKEILFKVISNLSPEYDNAKLGLHAGYFETSLALFTHPTSVRIKELKIGSMPSDGNEWDKSQITKLICEGLLKTSPSGVIGDPRLSTAIDGEFFLQNVVKGIFRIMFINIIFLIFLSMSLFSCSKNIDVLTIGILNPPISLKSWKIRDGVSTLIGNQIHLGLIKINPQNGEYTPGAAQDWKYLTGNRIHFRLNQSLKFHDGTPLDCPLAQDSFNRLLKKRTETSVLFPPGTSFSCPNSNTLEISLPFIPAQLLDILASPAAAISKSDGLIGLGNYRIQSQTSNDIQLSRFRGEGPNQLKFIIADHEELIQKFKNGEVMDLLYLGLFFDIQENCQIITGLTPTSFWFGVNSHAWAFNKKANRLAVISALNYAIHSYPIFNKEIPLTSLIPYGVVGNNNDDENFIPLFSPKIRSELERLVLRNGKIEITLRDTQKKNYDWEGLINTIDKNRAIFKITYLTNQNFFKEYYGKKLALFFIGGNVSRNDPFEVLSFFKKSDYVNQFGVTSPQVDKLHARAIQSRTLDEVKSLALQANSWILSEGYALPLFSKKFKGCVSPQLEGYEFSTLGPLSFDYSKVKFRY